MIRNILNKIDTKLEFSDKDSDIKCFAKGFAAGFLEGGIDALMIIGVVGIGLAVLAAVVEKKEI